MPPKPKYNKEDIAQATFSILRESGWSSVTARNISKKLNCSTQPLYSYLKSMDELAGVLRKQALFTLIEYQVEKYTDNIFLNMAVGYVKFAQDEKNLFQFLYFEKPVTRNPKWNHDETKWLSREIEKKIGQKLDISSYLGKINPEQMDDISLNGWLYAHGLANALSYGAIEPLPESKIIKMLTNAGLAFYLASKQG